MEKAIFVNKKRKENQMIAGIQRAHSKCGELRKVLLIRENIKKKDYVENV